MTLATLILMLALLWLQTVQGASSRITVSLECRTAPAPIGELRFTVQNDGPNDTAVLLGMALANGRRYELRDLTLLVKRPGAEELEEYQYRSRGYPSGVAGRIDHWILTLPAAAAYSMVLSPLDFFSPRAFSRLARVPSPSELSLRLVGPPVTYDLNLDMVGLRNLQLWTETATSKTIRVPEDCQPNP